MRFLAVVFHQLATSEYTGGILEFNSLDNVLFFKNLILVKVYNTVILNFINCMRIYIYMASINISLKKEAYGLLLASKRPDESFSDEIVREFGKKKCTGADLLEVFKLMTPLSKESEKEFEEGAKKAREWPGNRIKKMWEG